MPTDGYRPLQWIGRYQLRTFSQSQPPSHLSPRGTRAQPRRLKELPTARFQKEAILDPLLALTRWSASKLSRGNTRAAADQGRALTSAMQNSIRPCQVAESSQKESNRKDLQGPGTPPPRYAAPSGQAEQADTNARYANAPHHRSSRERCGATACSDSIRAPEPSARCDSAMFATRPKVLAHDHLVRLRSPLPKTIAKLAQKSPRAEDSPLPVSRARQLERS